MTKQVMLKEVLRQYRITHWVKNDEVYRQVTVSQTGEVSFRGEKKGTDIGRKRQFIIDLDKHPNSLIFIRQGVFKGGIGIVPREVNKCIVTENMPMFDIVGIRPGYLSLYLKSPQFKSDVNRLVPLGTAQKAIHEKQLLQLEMPLPTEEEQDKVIFKLNRIMEKKEQLSLNTSKNIEQILTLRQAILQEAISGKLVPQDPNDEPASELLKKTKAEKEKLIREKKIKKEKPLPPISEEEIPFALPNGWVWVRLIDLVALEKNAIKRGPFGGSLRKEIFVKDGYLVYEQRHAIHNDFEYEKYFITPKKFEEMRMFKVVPGDLIISCSGVTLGKISELPKDAKEGIINQALLKIKLNNELVKNDFFINLFNSIVFQTKIFEKAKGSAIPNMVGVDGLKQIVIGLPPIHEQERIVQKINQLMKLSDDLEVKIRENKRNSELLIDAVLKEAFAS
jgi:type I restriction enzyme S subunit